MNMKVLIVFEVPGASGAKCRTSEIRTHPFSGGSHLRRRRNGGNLVHEITAIPLLGSFQVVAQRFPDFLAN